MSKLAELESGLKTLSACCRAELVECVTRAGTRLDPEEYGDRCSACGHEADAAEYRVDPVDGTLTDLETGESGLEETVGSVGDHDPDAEAEERRERRGEGW